MGRCRNPESQLRNPLLRKSLYVSGVHLSHTFLCLIAQGIIAVLRS